MAKCKAISARHYHDQDMKNSHDHGSMDNVGLFWNVTKNYYSFWQSKLDLEDNHIANQEMVLYFYFRWILTVRQTGQWR